MLRFALFAAVLAFPSAAKANPGASAGMRISLNIPEICQLEASIASVDPESGVTTGNVFEMCNASHGFRVIASHRKLVAGETARIVYAGQTSPLAPAGLTEISVRQGPVAKKVPFVVQARGLREELAISLGITAL